MCCFYIRIFTTGANVNMHLHIFDTGTNSFVITAVIIVVESRNEESAYVEDLWNDISSALAETEQHLATLA